MATATTPTQLKNIILSRLGSPVVTVNVTEPQVYECIDRALELYVDYHFDGVNKMYLVHTLTENEVATGLIDTGTKLQTVTRVFRNSAGLSGGWHGGSIYDAGWHTAADLIKNMSGSLGGSYQGSGIFGGGGYGLAMYDAFHQYMELLNRFFTPELAFWHNSDSGKLKILSEGNMRVGQIVIIECYVAAGVYVDQSYVTQPNATGMFVTKAEQNYHNQYSYTEQGTSADPLSAAVFMDQAVYNNRWMKDMATAFTKQQWGQNLKKFSGQPLPGGVQINGQQLFDEANAEIEILRKELLLLAEPLPFFLE